MTAPAEPSETPSPISRYRAALRRWSFAAVALGTLGVVASEVAGGAWPVTFVTPLARQLSAMLALGAVGLLVLRYAWREPSRNAPGVPASTGLSAEPTDAQAGPLKRARQRRDDTWLIVAIVVGVYATLVALGAAPWRDVPTLARVTDRDANLGTLKVLSANVHSSNRNSAALQKLIADERPDVVLLMELNSAWVTTMSKSLAADYPVRQVVADDAGNFGLGVWSKLPGEAKLVVRQRLTTPSLLDVAHAEMTLTLDGHAVRIFGLHALPPLTPAMKGARDALLMTIADVVAKADVPTIVAGDLNATRYCRITREVCDRGRLRDAMAGVGTSWPMTLARPVMGIRIDQILADDAWRVVESHAGTSIGSDHLPMIATLQLARAAR